MTQNPIPSPEARKLADDTRNSGVKQLVVTVEAATAAVEVLRANPMPTEPPSEFAERFAIAEEVIVDAQGNAWVVYSMTARDHEPERTIVYTHGGGFIMEMSIGQWAFCANLVVNTAARVVIPIYPLSPEGTGEFIPDMIADIAAKLIADEGPDRVSLLGLSVGGTMTLSAAQILRDRSVPNPYLTVLIVPVLDIRYREPEMAELDELDPFLSPEGCRYFGSLYRGGLPDTDARVSPILGDNNDLGRLLLFSGTHDILNCQAREYAAMAPSFTGTTLEYHEAPHMIHTWATTSIPEGRAVQKTIYQALRG